MVDSERTSKGSSRQLWRRILLHMPLETQKDSPPQLLTAKVSFMKLGQPESNTTTCNRQGDPPNTPSHAGVHSLRT